MSSSDSGDQASARGMSLLLLILYSRVFFTGFYFREFRDNVVYLYTYIYMYSCRVSTLIYDPW